MMMRWCVVPALVVSVVTSSSAPVKWTAQQPEENKPAAGYTRLAGVNNTRLYLGSTETGYYSHHAQIFASKDNVLFASWSNGVNGEDCPGQRVLFSMSKDNGSTWDKWTELFPPMDHPRDCTHEDRAGRILTPVGFLYVGDAIYASAFPSEATPAAFPQHDFVFIWQVHPSMGPIFWTRSIAPEPKSGFPTYPNASDPRFTAAGAAVETWRVAPRTECPWWCSFPNKASPDAGLGEVTRAWAPDPSKPDSLVRVWRSNTKEHVDYADSSDDDAHSKGWTGLIPQRGPGAAYLLSNAAPWERDPLAVTIAFDGTEFSAVRSMVDGAPPVRKTGIGKVPGFQYPAAVIYDDRLWGIYSISKEDMYVSWVPLSELPTKPDWDL